MATFPGFGKGECGTPVCPGGVRLKVQGRDCDEEILALPEGHQVLLGQVPLETMDWWIDLHERRLVAIPERGGQWMAEVF